ncbi:MAG: hypothetical protein JW384_03025 [Nitrosomonadaceae bacterium]|nr:hypothetical protein [Nitrosomonadaceae bacterium]
MWLVIRAGLGLGSVGALIVTILATLFLTVGTVLAMVFAVSVWEATLMLMGIAGMLYWSMFRTTPAETLGLPGYPDPEEGEQDTIVFPPEFPYASLRRSRRRKR